MFFLHGIKAGNFERAISSGHEWPNLDSQSDHSIRFVLPREKGKTLDPSRHKQKKANGKQQSKLESEATVSPKSLLIAFTTFFRSCIRESFSCVIEEQRLFLKKLSVSLLDVESLFE